MSLAILFNFLCAQHVSDINIPIIRSLRLFCWTTTLVMLFLVRCVLEFRCGWVGVVSVLQAEICNTDTTPTQPHRLQLATRIPLQPNHTGFSLQHGYHSNPTTPASACNTDTTPTQPHRLQPATLIQLQPSHTGFSLQHGYHSNPTTPASACYTDTTPNQPHRLQPATLIPLQPSHTGFSLLHWYHSNPATPKLQHTSTQEQYDQCVNSTEYSQAPDDGYINVRNMLST